MTTAELLDLVRQLRRAQEAYRTSRRYEDYARAEDLARRVDTELQNQDKK